jgi:hypothetical protein
MHLKFAGLAKHATIDEYIAAIPEPLREVAAHAREVRGRPPRPALLDEELRQRAPGIVGLEHRA